MSRFRRMAHNVATSYAVLVVASLFSLATVPLALHYLGAESGHFSLWLLMATITGYLSLIDLGMSSSVARLLIDYKDRRDGGEYGSLIKTGWLVLLLQAALILAVGVSLAPLLAVVLKIDLALRTPFIELLGWQSASLALAFGLRIFSHILSAHQRYDIQNYGQISGQALNFVLMWLFFRAGHGVFSLAWATLLTNLYSGLICLGAGWQLKLFPTRGAWGKVCGARFRELFRYGQDMFLVALGTQMIMASQILIIQRSLGSVAAATWGLGTRTFTLVCQLIWRISDMGAPAFSEMIARDERQKLRDRYRDMVILTTSLSGFFAVGFALCNSVFVTVWTQGRIHWPEGNDLGLALWMIVMAVIHCHNSFVLWTKNIAFMRYVYFIEGLVFVALALMTAQAGGMLAIIVCSLICSCLFSGVYGVWRISDYFQVPWQEVIFRWSGLMLKTILFYIPMAGIVWLGGQLIPAPALRLAISAVAFGSMGTFIFLRYGLPRNFQHEISQRAPRITLPILKRILIAR